MQVTAALRRYTDIAIRGDLLSPDLSQREVADTIAHMRTADAKSATEVLGSFPSWPLARKREFARLLMIARNNRR